MAPLIQECDSSFSFSDDLFDHQKSIADPLHFHESAMSCTTTTTTASPKKSVSFAPMMRVTEVMSRYEYTGDELEASFYDPEDLRVFKETARFEGRLLEAGRLCPRTGTPRGIEHRTRDGLKSKRRNRFNAYAAVFFEIDCGDEDTIADAYYTYSEPCAAVAHALGKRDELEAMRIHHGEAAQFETVEF